MGNRAVMLYNKKKKRLQFFCNHHTIDYLQKTVTYLNSLVHLSKVSIYVNEHISAIRMKSLCVIVHKQESNRLVMLSI